MNLKTIIEQLEKNIEEFEENYCYLTVEKLLKYLNQLSFELNKIDND